MSVRKILKNIGLSLLTLCTMGLSQGCYQPSGIPMKGPADGVITAEESAHILDLIRDEYVVGPYVDSSIPYDMRDLLNDISLAVQSDNLGMATFNSDVHIQIFADEASFERKHREVGSKPNSPSTGFYTFKSNTIFLPPKLVLDFIEDVHHEKGHEQSNKHADLTDSSKFTETYSTAYQNYMLLKLYAIDQDIGSLLLDRFFYIKDDMTFAEYEQNKDITLEYHYGDLIALHNFVIHEGDLEEAIKDIFNTENKTLESRMLNYIGGKDISIKEAQLMMLEKLADAPELDASYEQFLLPAQIEELKDYMKIKSLAAQKEHDPTFDRDDEYLARLEDFIADQQNSCPYFYSNVSVLATWALNEKINRILGSAERNDWYNEYWKAAETIIQINSNAPCEFDPLFCPEEMTVERYEHLQAYAHALRAARYLEHAYGDSHRHGQAIEYAHEFFEKFFDEYYYPKNENDIDKTPIAIQVANDAALLEESLADTARYQDDLYSEVRHRCNAAYWYDVVNIFDPYDIQAGERSGEIKNEYICEL